MDRVVLRVGAELSADRAGRGFVRVGRADDRPVDGNGVFPFEKDRFDGAGRDVGDEVFVERLVFQVGVERLGLFRRELHLFLREDFEGSVFVEREDLLLVGEGIGLDESESLLDVELRLDRGEGRRVAVGAGEEGDNGQE